MLQGGDCAEVFAHCNAPGIERKLALLIEKQLGKKSAGIFTVPGLVKLTRKNLPPRPIRQGIDPRTKHYVGERPVWHTPEGSDPIHALLA